MRDMPGAGRQSDLYTAWLPRTFTHGFCERKVLLRDLPLPNEGHCCCRDYDLSHLLAQLKSWAIAVFPARSSNSPCQWSPP